MDRPVEQLSDAELGKLLYHSAAVLAQATNLQRNDPSLKEAAMKIDAGGDLLAAFDELERADPGLAESVLITALSTLAHGKTMHFANKEMKRRMHENN
ncbi:MAG TPA: hypothetical protein DDZ51_04950 [Planctomycetaceae bacterium]|nr:hypothetical protein [Planctomycetaceae bacterium]